MSRYVAAGLAGAASGCRSFTGIAVLALTSPPGTAAAQPERAFGKGWVRGLVGLVAAQELVMDKLPKTPSRLEPLGLGSRAVGAAASGLVLGQRAPAAAPPDGDAAEPVRDAPPRPAPAQVAACVAIAVAGAAASAWVGERLRGLLADKVGSDLLGAVLEDGLAVGLGLLAARTS